MAIELKYKNQAFVLNDLQIGTPAQTCAPDPKGGSGVTFLWTSPYVSAATTACVDCTYGFYDQANSTSWSTSTWTANSITQDGFSMAGKITNDNVCIET